MSGQTLQDGLGDDHCLKCLLAIDVRLTAVLHTIDELRQFLCEGVGTEGIDWQSLNRNEMSEDVFLELLEIGSWLAGHVEWSGSKSQSV